MGQIAVYARVSTDRQETGLEAQTRAIFVALKGKGIKNWRLYKDEGISGAKSSRPGLNELMLAARSGKISSIYVYSFSRFARSTKHLLSALEEFQSLGIEFISLSENLDTSTAMGRLVFTFISALSEFERELVVERVRTGLANAKAKGVRLGRPCKRNDKAIKELASKGLSYREIAEATGVSASTVCRVLKGYRSSNKEVL